MRRTVGGRVAERRLTHLPGTLRLLVIALVALSAATILTLAFSLAVGRDYSGPDFAILRTALSMVIIAGAGLGVATVGATRALDDRHAVTKPRHRRGILTDGLLTGAALTILFALVAVDAPAFTGMGRAPVAAVRALLWLALAAALLVALRRPSSASPQTAADSDRLRRLALPTVLLVGLIVLVLLLSQSPVAVSAFVLPGLTVVALAALVVVPAILVSATPWTIIGLATLALVAGLFRGDGDCWRRAGRWGVAMTLAVLLSLLAPRSVPFDLPSFLVDGSLINLRALIVLLIIGSWSASRSCSCLPSRLDKHASASTCSPSPCGSRPS